MAMKVKKDVSDLMSQLSRQKYGKLLETLAKLDTKHEIGRDDTQLLLDCISDYIGELASDCYSEGFTDGAAVGLQKGEQVVAQQMALMMAPETGMVN